jgi:prepilin-type N-terminal cleavage/methylation domain-containing protein
MMKHGFTLIELMVVIAIVATVAAFSIPNLLRAQMNANQISAKTTCSTAISEAYTFSTSKGRMPDRIDNLAAQIGEGILLSTFDQNADDSAIATNGAGASADVSTSKGYKFIFLYKFAGETIEHETMRGIMAAPVKFGRSGDNAYYLTTESGQVFAWRECYPLAVNSPATASQGSGEAVYFKPTGPASTVSALVYASNLDASFVGR